MNMKMDKSIDLDEIARKTSRYVGAKFAALEDATGRCLIKIFNLEVV